MPALLFYDSTCALCHGLVRWVLARDRDAAFHFAPLQGPSCAELAPQAPQLGDSVIIRDESGRLYARSDAVIFILRFLGRRRLARALELVPRPLRDLGYRAIARVRYAMFGRKDELCPIVPPELRDRFLP